MEAPSMYSQPQCHEDVSDVMSNRRATSNEDGSVVELKEPLVGIITLEEGVEASAARYSTLCSQHCKVMSKTVLGFSRSQERSLRGQRCSRLSLLLWEMKAIKKSVGKNNAKSKTTSCLLTNFLFDCRLPVSRKQKILVPPCLYNPPRKKRQCFVKVEFVIVGSVASYDVSHISTAIMYDGSARENDAHDLASFAKMSGAVHLP